MGDVMKKLSDKINKLYWACYRFVRDSCFTPIWYRFFGHKHHIIRTGLPVGSWIDVDYRMLYGMMNIIKWFVENDMQQISIEKYREWKKKIEKDEEDSEYKKSYLESIKQQYETNLKIKSIADWWDDYENRLKEIEEYQNERWGKIRNNYGRLLPFRKLEGKEEEEDKIVRDRIWALKEKLEEEETEMLIKSVKLRKNMWS
jgi:hypothetical protein